MQDLAKMLVSFKILAKPMQECNASKNLARNAIEARVLQEFFMEPKENALSRNDCIFLNHD